MFCQTNIKHQSHYKRHYMNTSSNLEFTHAEIPPVKFDTIPCMSLCSPARCFLAFSHKFHPKHHQTPSRKLPSSKLTWQWKSTLSNREYIFKWWIFHRYVSLLERRWRLVHQPIWFKMSVGSTPQTSRMSVAKVRIGVENTPNVETKHHKQTYHVYILYICIFTLHLVDYHLLCCILTCATIIYIHIFNPININILMVYL